MPQFSWGEGGGGGGGPYTGYMDAKVFDVILFFNTAKNKLLLHKHQWNTRWAFAQKLDIFTCENNMLSSQCENITFAMAT